MFKLVTLGQLSIIYYTVALALTQLRSVSRTNNSISIFSVACLLVSEFTVAFKLDKSLQFVILNSLVHIYSGIKSNNI